ncbi:hypothetical protein PM082_020559 [Marasmius tenuissimus]|nr:hypothetical protein PM082_020559 [Marasmius tenuissimus]
MMLATSLDHHQIEHPLASAVNVTLHPLYLLGMGERPNPLKSDPLLGKLKTLAFCKSNRKIRFPDHDMRTLLDEVECSTFYHSN